MQGDDPWFVTKDVCDVLEIRTDTLPIILDDDEFSNTNSIGVRIPGVNRGMTVITEPGLYALIQKSRKPEAKAFKRWVNHEVLPSIRKHGAYMTPVTLESAVSDPDFQLRPSPESEAGT